MNASKNPHLSQDAQSTVPPEPKTFNGTMPADGPVGGEIHFSWGYFGRSVEITALTAGNAPLYHASLPVWATHDVVLHQGGDQNGAILGAADMKGARGIRIGLDDPDTPSARWLELKALGLLAARKWEMALPGEKGPRHLDWATTNSAEDGVTLMKKLMLQHFRLTDRSTGRVVAVYVANFGGTGRLVFHEEPSQEMRLWVTLAAICLVLQGRKRTGAALAASGGST